MSPFSSAFQIHQEAAGLRTTTSDQKPSRMAIFLDRPSSPYVHILAFLQSRTASVRLTLPRGLLQMPASSAARMEALFEPHDEARYLGMIVLENLCEEEISRRQAECSARHGHGSAIGENVSVSSTEPAHTSTGPIAVPNATERIISSYSRGRPHWLSWLP
ncbi:hypothetical protein BS47DRAFT_126080 [Hydnum rufescens UP504]|uniref:Uncharacterized protein n=1 Tax=Hydnum rufescens UP504 TaxID=1448309 RepID=A0A9P6DY45_9AGAM|nr:hypothetical protein BS47DRAFT_126080 [Hydnum rufescens UP504]